jgi:hypothetical protein
VVVQIYNSSGVGGVNRWIEVGYEQNKQKTHKTQSKSKKKKKLNANKGSGAWFKW